MKVSTVSKEVYEQRMAERQAVARQEVKTRLTDKRAPYDAVIEKVKSDSYVDVDLGEDIAFMNTTQRNNYIGKVKTNIKGAAKRAGVEIFFSRSNAGQFFVWNVPSTDSSNKENVVNA